MTAGDNTEWFGQPRGLTILFLTEMWEKFSFYGMRALLVYYMVKALGFSATKASLIYGLYTAFIYFTPIFGGLLADRWLGRKKAVVTGASIMALGHFALASSNLLYPALALIALGNGLFLPNLPSQIGPLFDQCDPRRGAAFNVYYMGVNLGAFFAPLVCGTLGEIYGWHYGFGASGIGMCLGLVVYILGGKWLPSDRRSDNANKMRTPDGELTGQLRSRLGILAGIILAVVLFRGAYEQIGNTLALWADGDIDRSLAGFVIPATWFQSLNPLLVFLLTPPLVIAWTALGRRGREPSPLRKMTFGALGLSISFLGLAVVSKISNSTGVSPSAMVLCIFIAFYTLSELMILPVGLDLFSRLSNTRYQATTIAAWFFAAFLGNLLAGYLGSFWDSVTREAFFTTMAITAASGAVLLAVLDRPARALESRISPAANSDGVYTGEKSRMDL